MPEQKSIKAVAEELERLSVKLIQDQNWEALEKMLAPGCQFVSSQGSCDKEIAMQLMKKMHLGPVKFKDFIVTEAQDNLIVSFWMAAVEYRDGKELSSEYSPRLSVWKKIDGQYLCIAYADLITS